MGGAAVTLDLEFEFDDSDVVAAVDSLEMYFTNVIKGLVKDLFYNILKKTPQYTGAYAASWSLSQGTPFAEDRSALVRSDFLSTHMFSNVEDGFNFGVKQKGDAEAIGIALNASYGALNGWELGRDIFITNGVLDQHGYAYGEDVELGKINLRPVNRPGNAMMASVYHIDLMYQDISEYSGRRFAKEFQWA